MPRTKLAGDAYKDKDLAELIRRYKYGKGLNNEQAAKLIGVCPTTWKAYVSAPGKIPLEKLRKIQQKLGIPKEEICRFLV